MQRVILAHPLPLLLSQAKLKSATSVHPPSLPRDTESIGHTTALWTAIWQLSLCRNASAECTTWRGYNTLHWSARVALGSLWTVCYSTLVADQIHATKGSRSSSRLIEKTTLGRNNYTKPRCHVSNSTRYDTRHTGSLLDS